MPYDITQAMRVSDHGRRARRRRPGNIPAARRIVEPFPDRPQLQADQHERQHVEHEDRGLPHRIGRHPQPRRRARRCGARERDGIDDDGQDAGQADMLGHDPDPEGAGELHDDRARRIRDRAASTRSKAGRTGSRRRRLPTTASAIERGILAPCEDRTCHGADRDAVDQQRAGVVEQALAFEDREHAVGQLDLAQDRGCGRRIGRRDDGAERDRGRPRACRAPASARRPRRRGGERRPRRRPATRPAASCPSGRAARCR